jgi:hypothetical protein
MPEALTLAVARSRSGRGRGRGRRYRRLPARPHPRSVSAGVGPGAVAGLGINIQTMAAGARYERPHRAPAAGAAGRAGHNPSWAPAKPWAVAASPRSEHSHLGSPAIWPSAPSRMAATARRERSRREPAAARRHPGATSAPPTCANVRMPLSGADGSAPQTAHIGPPPPRAEPRRGPPPAGGAQRSCPCRELRPACTRGTHLPAAPGPRLPANWGCAAPRRAHVGNRAPCVHPGLAFRHPPVPQGRLCLEPRPACTRGTHLLARARPRHLSSRQDDPAGWAPCQEPRAACTRGTRFPVMRGSRRAARVERWAPGQARTGGRPVQPWPVLSLSDPRRSVCPRSARLPRYSFAICSVRGHQSSNIGSELPK